MALDLFENYLLLLDQRLHALVFNSDVLHFFPKFEHVVALLLVIVLDVFLVGVADIPTQHLEFSDFPPCLPPHGLHVLSFLVELLQPSFVNSLHLLNRADHLPQGVNLREQVDHSALDVLLVLLL